MTMSGTIKTQIFQQQNLARLHGCGHFLQIGVIRNLLPKVDRLLIGGAMANTFLYAMGHKMGASKLKASFT